MTPDILAPSFSSREVRLARATVTLQRCPRKSLSFAGSNPQATWDPSFIRLADQLHVQVRLIQVLVYARLERKSLHITCWASSPGGWGPTMDGLSRMPSNRTFWSAKYLKVSAQIACATSNVSSIECSPSSRTSGSTMGTRPLSYISLVFSSVRIDLRQTTWAYLVHTCRILHSVNRIHTLGVAVLGHSLHAIGLA